MKTVSRMLVYFVLEMLVVTTSLHAFTFPEAKVTVRVVDEEGSPLGGIEISVGFEGSHGNGKIVKGTTDAGGLFIALERTAGIVSFRVRKEGYYDIYSQYDFVKTEKNNWYPWNPEVKLVLRKKVKPVPMYARNTKMSRLEIPVEGKEVGFDLMEYEWLPPYGIGEHADFIFKLDKILANNDDFDSTLTITFPNKYDGIQLIKENYKYGSVFKMQRYAPAGGYRAKLIKTNKKIPGAPSVSNSAENNNYIFRVRSEEKDGKLVRAMYGKIQGDIIFDPREAKTALLGFTYYLNPDYTNNLEYDPTRNLFENLRGTERVGL